MRQFSEGTAGGRVLENTQEEGYVSVTGGHHLHYVRTGTKGGIPLVVCHGGPGAWLEQSHVDFFRNSSYDVVLYSQRGCGKSTRDGEPDIPSVDADSTLWLQYYVERADYLCGENAIGHLIEDLDVIRRNFYGEDRRIHLFGGSFGGSLAMLYAIRYPQHVGDLILRCTSLMELGGRMNPADPIATGQERIHNPAFRELENKLKKLVGVEYVSERLFDHMNEGFLGDEWTYQDKAEVALLWRIWNKTNHSDRMTYEVARTFVEADLAENIRYGFVFTRLYQDYKKFGENYFRKNLPSLHDQSESLILQVHGLNDQTCPVDNAAKVMEFFCDEKFDSRDFRPNGAICSEDGRAVLFPVDAGHSFNDAGIEEMLVKAFSYHHRILFESQHVSLETRVGANAGNISPYPR